MGGIDPDQPAGSDEVLDIRAASAALEDAFQTDSLTDIGDAIEQWRAVAAAVEHADLDPEAHGYIVNSLAILLTHRWRVGGRSEDGDSAIVLLEAFIAAHSDKPADGMRVNLANALLDRFDRDGDPKDLTRASDSLDPVRSGASRTAPPFLQAQARVLGYRYHRTGALADLDGAIALLEAIVGDTASADAPTLVALGNALGDRHAVTWSSTDLDRSVELLEQALALADARGPDRTRILANLGAALRTRHAVQGNVADLDRAIACQQVAVSGAPHVWGFHNNLAMAQLDRARLRRSSRDARLAIVGFRRVLDHTPAEAPDLPGYLMNLAAALELRSELEDSDVDLGEAVATYERACSLGLQTNVDLAFDAALQWALSATWRESWLEAATAFDAGIAARDRLLTEQQGSSDKGLRLRRGQDVAPRAAYAFAKVGRLVDAVLAIERGRGMLVRPSGSGASVDSSASPLAALWDLAAEDPVVYVLSTEKGGLALIVRDKKITPAWLDGLTLPLLFDRTGSLLRAHRADRTATSEAGDEDGERDAWPRALASTTKWLWNAAMGQVLAGVTPARRIRLVPVGALSLLPLHAAWRFDRTAPTGRRYAGDDVVITYLPNAQSGSEAERRAARRPGSRLLVVAGPSTTGAPRLPNAHHEAQLAIAYAAECRVIEGDAASRAAVLAALPGGQDLLHLACHGVADLIEPLRSGLWLTGRERLTVADLLDLRLDARLVVLSACETAMTGVELLDESIGLPDALLQAGVAGVIASLWKVDDDGVLLVMAELYSRLRAGNIGPAEALRDAQAWVRDSTTAEKLARLDDLAAGDLGLRLSSATVHALRRAVGDSEPDVRDFADPTAWAAFTHIGA